MEDLTLRRLTKKVFPYIWLRHKLTSSIPSTIFPFSTMTIFSQAIGDAVIVYLHIYRPTLSYYLEKHIPSMAQTKMQFWTHVAFLCLEARLADDDVFDYFLTVCSLTAEVALHCYINGYDDALPLASVFLCAFFETELYEGFHKAGGWVGLNQYIKDSSCPELYEMVNCYIKKISSPSDRLPILILIKCEQLAADRRQKFMSLRSLKFGQIERQDKAKSIVSGIFYWDFKENKRIAEAGPGILKRMKSMRHKKKESNRSISKTRSDESSKADGVLGAQKKISNADKLSRLLDEAQPSESASTKIETRSNYEDGQSSHDFKSTEVREKHKNQLSTSHATSKNGKFSSSPGLRELCNFYESLSVTSEATMDNSKYFRSNDGTRNVLNSSVINAMPNRHKKVSHFERYPRFISHATKNAGNFSKSENFTPETVKSTESLRADVLSDLTKSFQELGLSCLYAGNSSNLDEKSGALANYAEIMEKCRYFQNKYSSLQLAILIPNDNVTRKTSRVSETEKCDKICFERQYNYQQFPSKTKKGFENRKGSLQKLPSITKKSRFVVTRVDENQLRLANEEELLKNCAIESVQKSRFAVKKVENDLMSRDDSFKIFRFSVTKVNENQITARNDTSLFKSVCTIEPKTVSRFRVLKMNEDKSKAQMVALDKNCTTETITTSRFTVTKVEENQSKDDTNIFGQNWTTETTKISRFTVTKVDGNKSEDLTSILKKNWTNEPTKISRFAVKKVSDNQLMSRAGTSMRKNDSLTTIKISRFSVTKVEEFQSCLYERNDSISGKISDDTENETVEFQDNGSVKYQKRVSFAEHPFISYYHSYSSDESPNSRTSRESLNQNSPEDSPPSSNSGQSDNQEDTLRTPTLRNTAMSERRGLFRRYSFSDSQSPSDNARSSNMSIGLSLLGRIFRRSNSRNYKVNESSPEGMKETAKQKTDEVPGSSGGAGV